MLVLEAEIIIRDYVRQGHFNDVACMETTGATTSHQLRIDADRSFKDVLGLDLPSSRAITPHGKILRDVSESRRMCFSIGFSR